MNDTLDVLVVAAHPDDAELSCGGTIRKMVDTGYRVGIVDMTRGELGTRGTPEIRAREAEEAGRILGISRRINLGIPDGDIADTRENREALIRVIRLFRPHILLINAPEDRHPDHPAASRLAVQARFYSGLARIETSDLDGAPLEPWRPHHVLHYMQSVDFEPTFVVDVSDTWERRMQAMMAFRSQFHQEGQAAAESANTYISTPEFLHWVESRARMLGYRVGATFGEGFLYHQGPIGVDDLVATLEKRRRT